MNLSPPFRPASPRLFLLSGGATLLILAPHFCAGKPAQPRAVALDAQGKLVTQALTRALRKRVSSPGGRLKIVVTPTSRAGQGYFSEVSIAGAPSQIKKFRISALDLRARKVRIDVEKLFSTGKIDTISSQTTLRAVVTESDLTRLLAQGKRTRDMGLKVKYIGGGKMRINGNLNYSLISGPISGVARLRLAPGYKVLLDILSLQLRGSEVPQFVKNQLSERINPIINYQDLPFQPRFRGLTMQGSRATLYA